MKGLLILLLLVNAVCAQAADAGKGKATFEAKCVTCHAKTAKGNPSMAKMFKVDLSALDLTDKDTSAKKNEELAATISKGRGKMPSFAGKLKDAEISDVIAYVRSLGTTVAGTPAPAAKTPEKK